MGYHKYSVKLTDKERKKLKEITSRGTELVRRTKHALILLNIDESKGKKSTDGVIATTLGVGVSTVERVRKNYCKKGFDFALNGEKVNRDYRSKVDGKLEAHLIMLACSEPPKSRARWTVRLLTDKIVELGYIGSISKSTVGLALKKTHLNSGR